MAVDMFFKIEGIDGESKDGSHTNEIDVLAWSWGMSQSATTHMGGGGGSGKVNVQDISFTKYVDKSSPELMKACMTGRHITEATLVVRKAGDKPLEYMTIKINDIIVSSVSTGGSGGEDRLTENVTLNFSQVDYKYIEQTDTGAEGDKPDVKWDIAKNEAM
ncbi:Hcp family type VI secretion system effector [Yoonia sp. R2331]|uniref:Hcp family type VI secretion system effector n=1 Tax=Yoonia sp. R2331 TaxID=3237238 RepID=UPI0034E5673E